jgi:hypothetical protein
LALKKFLACSTTPGGSIISGKQITAARLKGYETLEPDEAKVSRMVLRSGGTNNRSSLFSNTSYLNDMINRLKK